MGKYLVKRLLLIIPTLFIVCAITFALMRMVPMSAVDVIVNKLVAAGTMVDEADVEAMLGLDKPAIQQFFIWLWDVIRGDLGDSYFDYVPVSQIILEKLPATLELSILTLIITNVISIPLGLYCAARQDTVSDYTIRIISIIFISMPQFWLATLILIYPNLWWGWAPQMTYVSFLEAPLANLEMFLIPAILSGIATAGGQLRTVRTMTLEVMRQDYIRTAWSKGMPERQIMFKYAFRNAMIPIFTMIGSSVGRLMSGNVIMETIFNIPGLGTALVNALNTRDYPIVQGVTLILSFFVLFVNVLVDIGYKVIDPRVRID